MPCSLRAPKDPWDVNLELLDEDHFPSLKSREDRAARYLSDFTSLAYQLSVGPDAVIGALRRLENRMRELAGIESVGAKFANLFTNYKQTRLREATEYFDDWASRGAYVQKDISMARNPMRSPKVPRFSRLLSRALAEADRKNGFHLSEGDRVPTYVGALDVATFCQGLEQKRHWKDVGVISRHGEFTHRIQWYVICDSGWLLSSPVQVFRAIARKRKISGPTGTAIGGWGLWDALVDRGVAEAGAAYFRTTQSHDFRSPEYFNDWLTTDAKHMGLTLLSTFLKARKAKRDTIGIEDYIALKRFGKPYNDLGEINRRNVYASKRGDPEGEPIL